MRSRRIAVVLHPWRVAMHCQNARRKCTRRIVAESAFKAASHKAPPGRPYPKVPAAKVTREAT